LAVLAIVILTSSAIVGSLAEKNQQLRNYQQVRVTTNPPGAKVAFVPIDKRTGEASTNPEEVVRPQRTTPFTARLQPGRYFVEAVIFRDDDVPDIAEEYFNVHPLSLMVKDPVITNRKPRADNMNTVHIKIRRTNAVVADMIPIQLSDELRSKDSSLPRLLYVDRNKVTPLKPRLTADGRAEKAFVDFETAMKRAAYLGKRLPTAAEYDAILEMIKQNKVEFSDRALQDLFSKPVEWTTTRYDYPDDAGTPATSAALHSMHILKGGGKPDNFYGLQRSVEGDFLAHPDTSSQEIGFRCVRSGEPRFAKP